MGTENHFPFSISFKQIKKEREKIGKDSKKHLMVPYLSGLAKQKDKYKKHL